MLAHRLSYLSYKQDIPAFPIYLKNKDGDYWSSSFVVFVAIQALQRIDTIGIH